MKSPGNSPENIFYYRRTALPECAEYPSRKIPDPHARMRMDMGKTGQEEHTNPGFFPGTYGMVGGAGITM